MTPNYSHTYNSMSGGERLRGGEGWGGERGKKRGEDERDEIDRRRLQTTSSAVLSEDVKSPLNQIYLFLC